VVNHCLTLMTSPEMHSRTTATSPRVTIDRYKENR